MLFSLCSIGTPHRYTARACDFSAFSPTFFHQYVIEVCMMQFGYRRVRRYVCFFAFIALSVSSVFVPVQAQMDAEAIRSAAPVMDTSNTWTIKGNAGINLTNLTLSNWGGGGDNATSLLGLFNIGANYKSPTFSWDNALELGYGLTWLGVNAAPRKSDDRIILISKAAVAAAPNLRWTGIVDFRTQFTDGVDYKLPALPLISSLFAPAFLTAAIGAEWKPAEFVSVLVAPVTGRIVIVQVPTLAEKYGLVAGNTSRGDFGALLNVQFKKEVFENVNLQSRLNVFAPYSSLSKMAVVWENLLIFKVNTFLNVSWATDILYDEKISVSRNDGTVGPATQFRSSLAIGFVLPF
jgi:hypothetical protein